MILHESVYDEVVEKLKKAYGSIMTRRGDPLDDGTLYGPMHSQVGVEGYKKTIEEAKKLGGKVRRKPSFVYYISSTVFFDIIHC